jgi:hypothetical protein
MLIKNSNGKCQFKARRRWYTWLTNIIFLYIVFIIAPWPILEMYIGTPSAQNQSSAVYLLAIIPIIGFITVMFATRSYSVTKDCIKIHLVGGSISVFIPEIERINRIHWLSLFFGFRCFGFGGNGECFGLLWVKSLGKVTAFATNHKNLVLIEKQDGKKLLISPEHPDKFIETVLDAKQKYVPDELVQTLLNVMKQNVPKAE